MATIHTLGIMGALLIGAFFILYHVVSGVNLKNAQVLTGTIGGVRISMEFRWVILLQMLAPVVLFTGVFALVMGFLFQQIGASVEDPALSSLAQLCGWLFFVASFAYLTVGPLGVFAMVGTLRRIGKKEREQPAERPKL